MTPKHSPVNVLHVRASLVVDGVENSISLAEVITPDAVKKMLEALAMSVPEASVESCDTRREVVWMTHEDS